MSSPARELNERLAKSFFEDVPVAMGYIRRKMRAHAAPELTVPEFRVLAQLFRAPRANAELAANQGLDSTTMTRRLAPLVRRGLVERAEDPADRRRLVIGLTRKGRELFLSIRKEVSSQSLDLFDGLNEREKKTLLEGLSLLKRVVAP